MRLAFTTSELGAIYEFIEYVEAHSGFTCKSTGAKLLHNMLGIDEQKLEQERRQMLEALKS